MNWYKIFYWLTVADNFKTFFCWGIGIFMAASIISTLAYLSNTDDADNQKMARKWMWWSYPFCTMFWFLYLLTPSKTDTLLITRT